MHKCPNCGYVEKIKRLPKEDVCWVCKSPAKYSGELGYLCDNKNCHREDELCAEDKYSQSSEWQKL